MTPIAEITSSMTLEQLESENHARDAMVQQIRTEKRTIRQMLEPLYVRDSLMNAARGNPALARTILHDSSSFESFVAKFGIDVVYEKIKAMMAQKGDTKDGK